MKYRAMKRAYGGFRGYLQHLHDLFQAWPDRTMYPVDRLRGDTREIADLLSIPPPWLWAVVVTEAGYPPKPVGIAGTGWADDPVDWAYRHNTSAYGVTQMTGTTFDGLQGEVTSLARGLVGIGPISESPVDHDMLYIPRLGILAGGVYLRRLIRRHGLDPEAVFTAYTGKPRTARLKIDALRVHGHEVEA